MGKLNAKLIMITSRHLRTDGLTKRVNQTMQTLLRCYCAESGFDWTSHLSMVEFCYNCSINEATSHSPFEVMYVFQPSKHANRLLPLTGATAKATYRFTMTTDTRDVHQLIKLPKERMATRSTRTIPLFQPDDYVYLSTKGLNIRSKKSKHLRDQRLGPFKVICKIGINSYNYCYLKDVVYIMCFIAIC